MQLRRILFCTTVAVFAVGAVSYGGVVPAPRTPTVSAAVAQEAPTLSRIWFFKAKPGRELDFEAGVKAHLAWLAANAPEWAWTGFTVDTGPRVGEYGFVSSGHQFGDFDAYDAGREAVLMNFNETVAENVESMESIISVSMPQASNPPNEPFAFAQVITFDVAFAKTPQFESAIVKYHEALGDDWPGNYAWSTPLSGSEGPRYTLAVFHDSWADMAPQADLDARIDEVYGRQDGQMLRDQFADSVVSMESWIARIRMDLSFNPGM